MTVSPAIATNPSSPARGADRLVSLWLFAVAALVFLMVVVGGATRLTDSGLSITEWKPLLGAIPPLSDADWAEAFAKYQQIPEYHHVNRGMSLDDFKVIYWWEWSHRFLGRFVGVAFALPMVAFWLAGRLRPQLVPRLAGVLALGAVQGGIGWYMVMSGLIDRVDVSQYRLALHLGVAFLILGLLVWLALEEWDSISLPRVSRGARGLAVVLVGLVLLQVVLGAFVASLKAGLAFPTWPLMDGELVPDGMGGLTPWYLNLFEDIATVQFNHRLVAYLIALVAAVNVALLWLGAESVSARRSGLLLLAGVLAQAALGVWTLLAHVPLSLALAHQAGAAIVLALAVRHQHVVGARSGRAGVQPLKRRAPA